MNTDKSIRRQVRALTGETIPSDHLRRYDIDAIVSAIVGRYGLVDVETIDQDEVSRIIAAHDIRRDVCLGAAVLLRQVRDCFAQEPPTSREGQRALFDRFHEALSGLGRVNVLHEEDPDADEHYDNVFRWWAHRNQSGEGGEKARANLAGLLEKLQWRIDAETRTER